MAGNNYQVGDLVSFVARQMQTVGECHSQSHRMLQGVEYDSTTQQCDYHR